MCGDLCAIDEVPNDPRETEGTVTSIIVRLVSVLDRTGTDLTLMSMCPNHGKVVAVTTNR